VADDDDDDDDDDITLKNFWLRMFKLQNYQ